MSEHNSKPEEPSCPNCGADWIRSSPRFAVDGELSDMRIEEAANVYYQNEGEYNDTSVAEFECGNVVPTSELPRNS